jgi:hypothetical protein
VVVKSAIRLRTRFQRCNLKNTEKEEEEEEEEEEEKEEEEEEEDWY